MKTRDGRSGTTLYFTEGHIEGGLKLADRASGRTKRVVMMMQRDDQNCQEKAHKRNKNNFFDHGMKHCSMAPCRLYERCKKYIIPESLSMILTRRIEKHSQRVIVVVVNKTLLTNEITRSTETSV